jgi:uncharacterized alpha-E superfamily protein
MLSRTASGLFWLARYVERAENIARILLAAHRMAAMMRALGVDSGEWRSALIATGCDESFAELHGEASAESVIDYMTRDPNNPSSIRSCFDTARLNARAVRTALTSDMWDVLNESSNYPKSLPADSFTADRAPDFLDWAKQRSILFSGTYETTMLRTDAYFFTRLGTFVERAESTARILDVKYHVLLPSHENVGGAVDYHQWRSVLAALSAVRAYQWIYQERLQPVLIAELLILRREMPRSLHSCSATIESVLEELARAYGGKRGECHRLAGEMHAKLRYGRVNDIFQNGLHEFLSGFIDSGIQLGEEIAEFYMR